jgi:HemY protein
MRVAVWLILLFAAAVVAATALGQNDGLLTLAWRGWRLELSLNLALLLLLLGGFVAYLVLKGLDVFFSLPRRAGEWRALQRERAAHAALREAFSGFFAGRYSRAQRDARRAISLGEEYPDLPLGADHRLLAQVVAAGSLHRLQDKAGRDALLADIQSAPVNAQSRSALDGAMMLGAEWALDDAQPERASAFLAALPAGVARRTLALRLRLKAARLAHRTLEALELARLLAKHQAFSETAAKGLMRTLALEHLDAARDAEQLQRQWSQLSTDERRDSILLLHAVRKAASWGDPAKARHWLEPVWSDLPRMAAEERKRLALALAACVQGADASWLERAESAAKSWPSDPAVSFAAGLVCVERQLWGKAKQWLEPAAAHAALEPATRRLALGVLAKMARQEGRDQLAATYDSRAAALEADNPVL